MSENKDATENVGASHCAPSVRRSVDFAFRIWDGDSMLCWGAARQAAFNVNLDRGQRPLVYRVFTDPDLILIQLTPWVDRHGNNIYEGDVLEFDEQEWGGECRFVMEWIDGEWSHNGCHSDLSQWCRVIGNIHEQPELIQALCS